MVLITGEHYKNCQSIQRAPKLPLILVHRKKLNLSHQRCYIKTDCNVGVTSALQRQGRIVADVLVHESHRQEVSLDKCFPTGGSLTPLGGMRTSRGARRHSGKWRVHRDKYVGRERQIGGNYKFILQNSHVFCWRVVAFRYLTQSNFS